MPRCRRLLLACLSLIVFAPAVVAEPMSLGFEADGTAIVENALLRLRINNRAGRSDGIRSWFYKPTGYEMVDVLYRQLDADGGHLLGLIWDRVTIGDLPAGGPRHGNLFIPRLAAIDPAGRGGVLVQTTQDSYRLTRALIFRRDLATVEVRLELENLTDVPAGTSLRLHLVASPGARGQYQAGNDLLFMPGPDGPHAWQQALPMDVFKQTYGGDRCLLPIAREQPASMWTRVTPETAVLAGNYAALVNPDHGDGLAIIAEPDALLGFYNCPNITVEPLFRGFALRPGERWRTTVHLAAFTGAKGKSIVGVTPLYAVTKPLRHADGRLHGELLPCFRGSLALLTADGNEVWRTAAEPGTPIALDHAVSPAWVLAALDTAGDEIGRIDASGRLALYAPEVAMTAPERPVVRDRVHLPDADAVAAFLASRDFVVQCDSTASESVREIAEAVARHLGVGLAWTPRYSGKMIAFGSPERSTVVRNAGLLKGSVDADWPGAGRGAILTYDNFESTTRPLLLVAGSDAAGALAAAEDFRDRFVTPLPVAAGWRLWATPVDAQTMTWTRPETAPVLPEIQLTAARNEYESAQAVLTALVPVNDLSASLDPLIHEATGEPLVARFATPARRRLPPLRLRWAAAFPLTSPDGWPGIPDALLDRPETALPAGHSQVLWLTVLVAPDARPGRYRGRLSVTANGETQSLPITLDVLDFALPDTGLKNEAYMAMHLLDPNGVARPHHVDRLVQTLVEHRFRILHLTETSLLRWHISPEGAYRGYTGPSLIAGDDGVLLLDTSRLDWLIDRCDAAGAPYRLEYVIAILHVIGWPETIAEFRNRTPDRFAGRPQRGGHPMQSYWAQDMLELFRRHLERRHLADRVLVKVGDEPPGFDLWWETLATAARESGLRFGTAFNSIDWQQAEKALGSRLAQFKPLYQRFDPEFARRAQEAGHEVGWYNCGPPPRSSIGTPAAELRAYYWQAARYNLDFVARWGIQCWGTEGTTPQNVWTFRYAHHHSVLYPEHPDKPAYTVEGRGWTDTAPLDSIRFELIREGIEDADYVRVLRQAIADARDAGHAQAADTAEAVLDSIWREVFPSLNHYNPPYETVMASRARVAAAILSLQQAAEQAP